MESILAWGVDVVRFVQGAASPVMTVFMKGLSALGSEWFYLAILPVIYWCVDRRRGA
ncbi:MAG: phospholipid phosphatase, partial [Spirochaetaceae bacterium]|nr:phospholipid phosphatase [Spirochaetaceae bacterium]